MSVGLIYDPIYLDHDTGMHCETASRLIHTTEHLKRTGTMDKTISIRPRAATIEEISRVHSPSYIAYAESFARAGGGYLDGDTVASPGSYDAAVYAAGGVISAVDAVMGGEVNYALALVRPPGHHAIRNAAMGFCIFNNIAIAARDAMSSYKIDRVLIVDFDVHHGNGTQDEFYSDNTVLYFSTHQYPFYPGSGSTGETGSGDGIGYTVNIPLPAGCGDAEYIRAFEEVLVPVARRFKPQLILVSAGYDAHRADNISMMQVTTTGYANMVSILKRLADELCDGRLVFALEGGYNLDALADSIDATLNVLLDSNAPADPLGKTSISRSSPDVEDLFARIKTAHGLD
ncbi:MAG: histone deacetylase [Chloroflexota bacterium]|nr:histone deacetylase [Chloroflexota bacterium]